MDRCLVKTGWSGFRKGGSQGGNGMFSGSGRQAIEGHVPSVGTGN